MKKEILKMTLEEFKKHLRENSDNVFEGDGIAEDFEDIQKDFGLYCKKCGSTNIHLIGENGIDYGGQTGYSPGCNVLKCEDCGNAVSWCR